VADLLGSPGGVILSDEYDDYEFEFELVNSDDGLTVTLVCEASRPLTPDEFADALVAFAERMRILGNMNEEIQTMN